MAEITLDQLTEKKLDGTGVFDVILSALKLHLDAQHKANRITGPEYATVYLGQVEQAMQSGLSFVVQQQRINLEAQLMEQQILLAKEQVLQAREQTEIAKSQLELARTQLEQSKAELEMAPFKKSLLEAQSKLTTQQAANAIIEGRLIEAKICESQASFDYTKQNVLKATAEVTLIGQKTATEKAQVLGLGVDADSVIGRQKALYVAQTDGFKRDAEQKAAKLYVDVWSAQRMTDPDGTPASAAHGLSPDLMNAVMATLRRGIGA